MANVFSEGLVLLLWHCCKQIKFHSADSRILQIIDTDKMLKWFPMKVHNSVHFVPTLYHKQVITCCVINLRIKITCVYRSCRNCQSGAKPKGNFYNF